MQFWVIVQTSVGKSLSDFKAKRRAVVLILEPLSAGVWPQFTPYSCRLVIPPALSC